MSDFSPADLAQLAVHGIAAAEAERQLAQLRHGQAGTRLARPCTVGDGIRQLPTGQQPARLERFATTAGAGGVTRFIPASGAATRMFQPVQASDADGAALTCFVAALDRFPFTPALAASLARSGDDLEDVRHKGDLTRLLAALLEPDGLDYARLPKGLLPFHRTGGQVRTAFVEHLAEAARLVGAGSTARLHFTVSPEHRSLFERHLADWREELENVCGCTFDVTFSVQQPATDTLALAADGHPLRDADDRLLLRPGGHGALLANLADLEGEVVLIRNIDNVVPEGRQTDNLLWDRLLGGLLLELVAAQRARLEQLRRNPGAVEGRRRAIAFLRDDLGVVLENGEIGAEQLVALLDRPVRVCGMVRNSGEPGGGRSG